MRCSPPKPGVSADRIHRPPGMRRHYRIPAAFRRVMVHRRRRVARAAGRAAGGAYTRFGAHQPNNPTGSYVKAGEREQLVGLCRERGVAIIADEVFYDYALEPFPGNARLAGEAGALTFALDGFSKMLAAPMPRSAGFRCRALRRTFARPCVAGCHRRRLPADERHHRLPHPGPVGAAKVQTDLRGAAGCRAISGHCTACWSPTRSASSPCCGPRAAGTCCCACRASSMRTSWCCT